MLSSSVSAGRKVRSFFQIGRESENVDDDRGAVLVLALVFMVASALVITGLLAWGRNDLNSEVQFLQSRALTYAAGSAMQTAIQNVRYSTTACPSTGMTINVPNLQNSTYTVTMVVFCSPSTETEAPSAASRTITFSECVSTAVVSNSCPSPYLQAVVTYDDYTSGSIATGAACSTNCGENVSINSWVYAKNSY